jgi:hypothetical protein
VNPDDLRIAESVRGAKANALIELDTGHDLAVRQALGGRFVAR